jgi:hypothetical protein
MRVKQAVLRERCARVWTDDARGVCPDLEEAQHGTASHDATRMLWKRTPSAVLCARGAAVPAAMLAPPAQLTHEVECGQQQIGLVRLQAEWGMGLACGSRAPCAAMATSALGRPSVGGPVAVVQLSFSLSSGCLGRLRKLRSVRRWGEPLPCRGSATGLQAARQFHSFFVFG